MDHAAGFVGSVYVDCPNKPCYLCKRPGHTTATCPFRLGGEKVETAHGASKSSRNRNAASRLAARQLEERRDVSWSGRDEEFQWAIPKQWRVTAAVLKLHNRRVTCLDFCPARPSLIVSGDKRGQVAFWDYVRVFDKTVLDHGNVHMWLVTGTKFMPQNLDADHVYTSAVDGLLCRTNVETQQTMQIGNLNPGITWTEDMEEDGRWRSISAIDAMPSRNALLCGDDIGQLHIMDTRSGLQATWLGCKTRTKVCSVAVNPANNNLIACAGNDHCARLWDVRRMTEAVTVTGAPGNKALNLALATMQHPRVVSHVAFSPLSGHKLVTTCTDNRLRVWDRVTDCNSPPAREIVHSHDFSRYLTSFKGVFDPKDPTERTLVIGRYISEDFSGMALHPIDVFDVSTGRLRAELVDANVATISPVGVPHPSADVIAAGTSRNLFVWEPVPADELEEQDGAREQADRARAGGASGGAARAPSTWKPRMLDLDDGKKGGGKKGKGKGGDDDDDDEKPSKKRKEH